MQIHYSKQFRDDLARLHAFLAGKGPAAATRVAWRLRQAPRALLSQPRQGQRLKAYSPREMRRLLVGPYELRYEIQGTEIFLLNLWHTRVRRP